MPRFISRYGRPLLALLGLLAVAFLVYKVGPAAVLRALTGAGAWLPLILALDLGWLAIESFALLMLYGESSKAVRASEWFRSTLLHYSTFIVVPVGRASAEVARATMLAARVGKSRAAAAAALMQSLTLVTNALVTAVCLSALMLTVDHAATVALLSANVLVTGLLGVGLYSVIRHVKVGGFLGNRFKKLADFGPEIDEHVRESRPRHLLALLICVLARSVQAIQYGVILFAITGAVTLPSALIAEGIQLSGRSMGDAVPNQVGAIEGAFALSAGALGLSDHIDQAVAIALLGRISNLSVAAFAALCLQIWPRPQAPDAQLED